MNASRPIIHLRFFCNTIKLCLTSLHLEVIKIILDSMVSSFNFVYIKACLLHNSKTLIREHFNIKQVEPDFLVQKGQIKCKKPHKLNIRSKKNSLIQKYLKVFGKVQYFRSI